MKPESQLDSFNLENQPNHLTMDSLPEVVSDADGGIEKGADKKERSAELSAIASDVSMSTMPPIVTSSTPVIDDTNTTLGTPMIAQDDDLIEKEWVDRAKKIVSDTQNDPHKRDSDVSVLRKDYRTKRYGREMGASEQIAA